jgi:hypothetical protein
MRVQRLTTDIIMHQSYGRLYQECEWKGNGNRMMAEIAGKPRFSS